MTWNIVGHQWAVKLLQKHVQSDQVRHAYLISGEHDVGKRSLALRFAQALNCTGSDRPGELCYECRSCNLVPGEKYPDLHVITPEEDSSTIKIDQIRELHQRLALTPFEGRFRIAVIPDFEVATEEAANALLKTLEEPNEGVVVILTTIDAVSLLPTIVSRCEHIPLRMVSNDDILKAILARDVPPQKAALIASLAHGRPGWALRLVEDPDLLERRAEILHDLDELLGQSRNQRLDYVEQLLPRKDDLETQRHNARELLEVWMEVWQDAMASGFRVEAVVENTDTNDLTEKLNKNLNPFQVYACVKAIQQAYKAIQQYGNVRLAMEVFMIDLPFME